jgi:hypothetical protein
VPIQDLENIAKISLVVRTGPESLLFVEINQMVIASLHTTTWDYSINI